MSVKRCAKGHYYNEKKHSICPWCGIGSLENLCEKDKNKSGFINQDDLVTVKREHNDNSHEAVTEARTGETAESRTVGIYNKEKGPRQVAGWLVCIKGPGRGRDYRIYAGRNFIGRSPDMDIYLSEDDSLPRRLCSILIYDSRHNLFNIQPCDMAAGLALNGSRPDGVVRLNDRDRIELGRSMYMFAAFCRGDYKWD